MKLYPISIFLTGLLLVSCNEYQAPTAVSVQQEQLPKEPIRIPEPQKEVDALVEELPASLPDVSVQQGEHPTHPELPRFSLPQLRALPNLAICMSSGVGLGLAGAGLWPFYQIPSGVRQALPFLVGISTMLGCVVPWVFSISKAAKQELASKKASEL